MEMDMLNTLLLAYKTVTILLMQLLFQNLTTAPNRIQTCILIYFNLLVYNHAPNLNLNLQ